MDRITRSKLTMMGRALDFVRAHPSTDASWTALVARMEELLTRADTLTVQEREGRVGYRAATLRRREVRRQMQELVAHLVRVAQAASETTPALVGAFAMPKRGPHRIFEAAVKAMLAAATPHREVLIAHGLGETTLADLEAGVAGFDAMGTALNAARREHVGARAELIELGERGTEVVARLEGLVRARFRTDVEQLAAWESARSLATGYRGRQGTSGDEVPDTVGGVAPAPPVVEGASEDSGAAPAPTVEPEVPPQAEAG